MDNNISPIVKQLLQNPTNLPTTLKKFESLPLPSQISIIQQLQKHDLSILLPKILKQIKNRQNSNSVNFLLQILPQNLSQSQQLQIFKFFKPPPQKKQKIQKSSAKPKTPDQAQHQFISVNHNKIPKLDIYDLHKHQNKLNSVSWIRSLKFDVAQYFSRLARLAADCQTCSHAAPLLFFRRLKKLNKALRLPKAPNSHWKLKNFIHQRIQQQKKEFRQQKFKDQRRIQELLLESYEKLNNQRHPGKPQVFEGIDPELMYNSQLVRQSHEAKKQLHNTNVTEMGQGKARHKFRQRRNIAD